MRELIKKDDWDNTTNNYKDAGSVIYTNGIITNDVLDIVTGKQIGRAHV